MTIGSSWRWANASLPGVDRGGAWLETINRFYGPCDIAHSLPSEYDAAMDARSVDKFCVADIVCDAFEGRTGIDSAGRRPRSFNVQLIETGEKRLSSDGTAVLARQGDILINLGALRGDFEVRERSRVITVSMPVSRLKAWLPASPRRAQYRLPAGSTAAQLLTSNLKSVSTAFLAGSLNNGQALTEAMIGLVVAVLGNEDEATTSRQAKLVGIKSHIAANLDDPDLSPGQIAAVQRVSVRYLHALFEAEATTVQQYVIRERLLRCRRDLQNPCMRHRTITEIAYGCGFQSLTHFSRRFKETFGVSPRQFRASCDLA